MQRLDVFLIRPTKFDDAGYLLRHFRNVLPSNSLACLAALTEDVARRRLLGRVDVRTHVYDESVDVIPERRIRRLARQRGTRAMVCLVGVQTSQFPRAEQLSRRFRALGIPVLIGGFHVSGVLAFEHEPPASLRALLDAGVTLVKGEVEHAWGDILADAAAGRLKPIYDTLAMKPLLTHAPIPHLDIRLQRKFVYRHFGTLDAGRGCPFTCTFCTIINVQGQTMRSRDPQAIAAAIRRNYTELGTHHYFFTDDNFARNPNWKVIFSELIRLREVDGIPLRFLMQVDTLAHRLRDFVALARRAGCFQVFIGLESLNPDSLRDAGKRQNRIQEYAGLIDAWRFADILTHVGYIIGFPHDTVASVTTNIESLKRDLRVDIASFFMLTPLPGSVDHLRMLQARTPMDGDLNRFDTFHPVVDHPTMSRDEWFDLYRSAWRLFYSDDHLRQQLAAARDAQQVTLLQMYLWYLIATGVEDYHPMMTGFFRLKPRRDRQDGLPVDGILRHWARRIPEIGDSIRGYAGVLERLCRLWAEVSAEGARAAARGSMAKWTSFLSVMFGGGPAPAADGDRAALVCESGCRVTTDAGAS